MEQDSEPLEDYMARIYVDDINIYIYIDIYIYPLVN